MTQEKPDSPILFSTVIPVRWSDMDADGRVNNLVILRYAEEARMQWTAKLRLGEMAPDLMPVVAAVEAQYQAPIQYPCSLTVDIRCTRLGNSSLNLVFHISNAAEPSCLYATSRASWVWVDKQTSRPVAMPQALREHCAPRA